MSASSAYDCSYESESTLSSVFAIIKLLKQDKTITEMNWHSFLCQSEGSPSYYYYHWIPDNFKDMFPTESDLSQSEMLEQYEEFDTLIHCTTFENAAAILENGFKPQLISDSSVANKDINLKLIKKKGKSS